MVALSLDSAKNLAIIAALVFAALAVLSAMVIKEITTKLITVGVLALLAFVVWSQRSSLQDCAQRVRDRGVAVGQSEITCSFLGTDVKVPPAR